MKLTDLQFLVLRRIAQRNIWVDGAESGSEIAYALRNEGVAHLSVEKGQKVCVQLERKGLVVRLGSTLTGARTWVATSLGLDEIKAQGDRVKD